MKINIELNKKSVQDAIKILKRQKKILTNKAIPEYLTRAAHRIRQLANENIDNSDIGEIIKSYIKSGWEVVLLSKTQVILYNLSWKSAYVEFGVGVIGEVFEHPNASITNWEYDLPTEHKDSQGGWFFSVLDEEELDIPQDRIIQRLVSVDDEIGIYTKGTQGVWYLFNALEDFRIKESKSLWEQVKQKYWS